MPPFATDESACTQLSHAKTARGARTVAPRLATVCTQTHHAVLSLLDGINPLRSAPRCLLGLGRSLLARVSFGERDLAEFSLATHYIQHVDAITVATVEDPAGRLNDLAVAPARQFLRF